MRTVWRWLAWVRYVAFGGTPPPTPRASHVEDAVRTRGAWFPVRRGDPGDD